MTLLWTVQRWSGGGSYNEENQEAKQQKSKGVIKFDKRKFYVHNKSNVKRIEKIENQGALNERKYNKLTH